MRNIFEKRDNVKPYEYPELMEYANAILHSFWEIGHFNFDADMRDFKVELSKNEQEILEKCMLAINVVENKVKTFWSRLDMRMPKPEVGFVGSVFGSNEVVHALAYSELLEKLGLEDRFKSVMDVPCMGDRVKYLNKYLDGVNSRSNREFTKSLILFTLLVENVSLFSQFMVISSFKKYKNILGNFSKIVQATSADETIHGKFGAHIVHILRQENPEWFDEEMEDKTRRGVRKAFRAESSVLDWIFEKGELEHLQKDSIVEYLKSRFNLSLQLMGYEPEYEVDAKLLKPTKYFDRMSKSTLDIDFFIGRSNDYSKNISFDEKDLF